MPKLLKPTSQTRFARVSIGDGFGVALDIRGKVYGWGSNELGQLGYSFSANSNSEVCEVQAMGDKGIAQDVIAGQNFVIAKMTEVYAVPLDANRQGCAETVQADRPASRLIAYGSRNQTITHTDNTDNDSVSPDFKHLENKSQGSHPTLQI